MPRTWKYSGWLSKPKGDYISRMESREKEDDLEEEKEERVDVEGEETQEEVTEEADEGEMLVLRRAWVVKEVRKKNKERTSFTLDELFREKRVR